MKKEELISFLKDRGFGGYSSKKKDVLEKKVSEIKKKEASEEYERKLRDEAVCSPCLEQQRIQSKIDEREHDQRLLENTVRTLVCDHCQHPNFEYDRDSMVCAQCRVLQSDCSDENPLRNWR